MAEEKTFPMTLEGKKKLEDELEEYRLKRRPEVIKRIPALRSPFACCLSSADKLLYHCHKGGKEVR